MDVKNNYKWEIELSDGTLINNHNDFSANEVVRISYLPQIQLLSRHDLIFKHAGYKYVKRFSRAFMHWNSNIKEYLHCVVTNKFRFYLKSSNGQVLITNKDYELYL